MSPLQFIPNSVVRARLSHLYQLTPLIEIECAALFIHGGPLRVASPAVNFLFCQFWCLELISLEDMRVLANTYDLLVQCEKNGAPKCNGGGAEGPASWATSFEKLLEDPLGLHKFAVSSFLFYYFLFIDFMLPLTMSVKF